MFRFLFHQSCVDTLSFAFHQFFVNALTLPLCQIFIAASHAPQMTERRLPTFEASPMTCT